MHTVAIPKESRYEPDDNYILNQNYKLEKILIIWPKQSYSHYEYENKNL